MNKVEKERLQQEEENELKQVRMWAGQHGYEVIQSHCTNQRFRYIISKSRF